MNFSSSAPLGCGHNPVTVITVICIHSPFIVIALDHLFSRWKTVKSPVISVTVWPDADVYF